MTSQSLFQHTVRKDQCRAQNLPSPSSSKKRDGDANSDREGRGDYGANKKSCCGLPLKRRRASARFCNIVRHIALFFFVIHKDKVKNIPFLYFNI